MSFKFNLFVTGLCAFVPVEKAMRIVLVNARDYKTDNSSVDDTTPNTCIHIPLLAVPTKLVTADGRRPAFEFRNTKLLANVTTYQAFPLAGDDMAITPVTAADVDGPKPVDVCPSGNKDAFGWIARMYDAKAPKMLQKAAKTEPLDPSVVLARVRFAQGTCYTQAFALDPFGAKGKLIKWTYTDKDKKPLIGYKPRPIAELSVAQITISTGTKVIFESLNGKDPIVLAGADPQAVLVNLPFPDLLNEEDPKKKRERDHHFLHFYRLAVDKYTFAPSPLAKNCGSVPTGGLGGPKCPPTFFDGHE